MPPAATLLTSVTKLPPASGGASMPPAATVLTSVANLPPASGGPYTSEPTGGPHHA